MSCACKKLCLFAVYVLVFFLLDFSVSKLVDYEDFRQEINPQNAREIKRNSLFLRTVDFCKVVCSSNAVHVACKCSNAVGCMVYMAERQINLRMQLLYKLNDARNTIANDRQIGNMHALSYSASLEYLAKCSALECKDIADTCLHLTKIPFVKQLIYHFEAPYLVTAKEILTLAIDQWVGQAAQVKDNNWDLKAILMWSDARIVGCYMSYKPFYDEENSSFKVYYVCNFGTTGRFRNVKMYEVGSPCSNCRIMLKCNHIFKNICGEISLFLEENESGSSIKYHPWSQSVPLLAILYFLIT